MYDFEPENTPGATLRRLLLLLLMAMVVAFGIATRADSVRLHEQAGVESAGVTLGQVAELEGPAARAFAGLEVVRFADGDREKSVTLDMVEDALDGAGVNWGLVSLRGFNACKVTRISELTMPTPDDGQAVAANIETPIGLHTTLTLRSLVERRLAEHVGVPVEEVRIAFVDRDAQKLDVPILGRRVEIEPISTNLLGRVPLVVRFYEGQAIAETLRVTAQVQRTMLAVVAVTPYERGDVFTRSGVQVRECVIDDDSVEPVSDPDLIIGQEATASLRAGDLVGVRSVRSPVMVRRGEQVDVRCIVGGLVVRTVARAKQDGSLDDRIEVRNETTGESYLAVVTGRQSVAVSTQNEEASKGTTAMAGSMGGEVVR